MISKPIYRKKKKLILLWWNCYLEKLIVIIVVHCIRKIIKTMQKKILKKRF